MKILVVGGHGFVGRPLVKALCDRGDEVTVFGSGTIVRAEAVPDERAKVVEGYVNYGEDLWTLLQTSGDFDVLVWLAAKQGYDDDLWDTYGETNVQSIFQFLTVFKRLEKTLGRIVYASSQAVYSPNILNASEDSPKDPPSVYGLSKFLGEQAFRHLAARLSIPLFAMRYSIILGRGQSLQSTESGILRNWLRDARGGQPLCVYSDGQHVRDFVSIDDVTRANLAAIDAPKSVAGPYNIGGFASTILAVAETFAVIADAPGVEITGRQYRPGGEYSLTSSSLAARSGLRWFPEVSVEDQLIDFFEFAQEAFDNPHGTLL